jgi:hypothetical protein
MMTLCYVMVQRVYSWRQANSRKFVKHVHRKLRSYVVADQLDPKYQFILQAPDVDPEGNPTLVV